MVSPGNDLPPDPELAAHSNDAFFNYAWSCN